MDAEVANTLRRHLLRGRIDQISPWRALRILAAMRVTWWPHRSLLVRALALRDQLTAYDAIYVAIAEVTGATLLTRDAGSPWPPGTGRGSSWSSGRACAAG